ncbi:MAG: hypothetical protein R3B09_30360 [Nannocystaceae bacterium]
MVRSLFPGHRRYSITHRAVQRLRELVPTLGEDDDEALRDRLDAAITTAEDDNRAIRTLDVMLGEPQVLVPLENFGDTLYAIIKEETVVTVLPKGHGEEILQRGQALEQKVAAGEIVPQPGAEPEGDRWEVRRRWRREVVPPIVERFARGSSHGGNGQNGDEEGAPAPIEAAPPAPAAEPTPSVTPAPTPQATTRVRGRIRIVGSPPAAAERSVDESPVHAAIARGLERARQRAAVSALSEVLGGSEPSQPILPLWNQLLDQGLPESLTVEELITAVRGIPR